jgi:transposase
MRRTNLSELARELGISAPRLYRWQKKHEVRTGSFPGKSNL